MSEDTGTSQTSASPSSKPLYCLNVRLCVKPERREEFLTCIAANQKGTLSTEPAAVTYTYGEDATTPNTFHFFEQYIGHAGFVAHTQAPHFAAWETFASSDPFTAEPLVCFYGESASSAPGLGAATHTK